MASAIFVGYEPPDVGALGYCGPWQNVVVNVVPDPVTMVLPPVTVIVPGPLVFLQKSA